VMLQLPGTCSSSGPMPKARAITLFFPKKNLVVVVVGEVGEGGVGGLGRDWARGVLLQQAGPLTGCRATASARP
jgi:hypothetical protein